MSIRGNGGVVGKIRGIISDVFGENEKLTNSGLERESREALANMVPRSADDFLSRPVLGPGGKLRAAYAATSAVSVLAATFASDRTTHVVKPALMPLLVASADLFATKRNRKNAKNNWLDTGLLVGGVAFGCLGDIILMGKDGRSDSVAVRASNLNKGASAFAVNQLAYHALLFRQGARPQKKDVLIRVPVVLGGIGLAAWKSPAALPAAGGYGSALATTSILAEDHSPEAALGGNLFVLSDALILTRLALLGNSPKLDGLVDGAVMATYVAAQLLLVDALVRALVVVK